MHTTTPQVEPRRYQAHRVSDAAKEACDAALHRLDLYIPGVISTGVVGPDGFEIAALSIRPIEISKLSALSSTLVAVAQAFMLESGMASCQDLIMGSENGSVLLMSVPVGHATYALFVITGNGATLEQVLSSARICATEVGEALRLQ